MQAMAKGLIVAGLALATLGALLYLWGKYQIKLPGDILIRRERFTFYFPLASCLLISVVLSLLFHLFRR
jgi:hypothetical protein